MKIRSEQFDKFENTSRQQFHQELYSALETKHCENIKNMEVELVLQRMGVWHERALSYGINTERAMGRFLGIHLLFLPDFDETPKVKNFLVRSDMTGDQKMQMMFTHMRAT